MIFYHCIGKTILSGGDGLYFFDMDSHLFYFLYYSRLINFFPKIFIFIFNYYNIYLKHILSTYIIKYLVTPFFKYCKIVNIE